MTLVALRILVFTFAPLLLAWLVIRIDKSVTSTERKFEIILVLLFAIAVAGNGIFSFFGHLFLSDVVAESIGWEKGSPFQLEMAFANLAIGLLGMGAVSRRDGFWEATVIAVTVLGVGATIVHLMDIVVTVNLAPGNTVQNVGNLVKPALLIWALRSLRRAEGLTQSEAGTIEFARWRAPLNQSSAPVTITIATAYGLGFATSQLWLITILGLIIATVILVLALAKSPSHQIEWGRAA